MSAATPTGDVEAVRRVLAELPMDETGHVIACGFDDAADNPECGCLSLPGRLAAALRDAPQPDFEATLGELAPQPSGGALTDEERCPEDGQTLAWHEQVGGTDYHGQPRTNGAFIGCRWFAARTAQPQTSGALTDEQKAVARVRAYCEAVATLYDDENPMHPELTIDTSTDWTEYNAAEKEAGRRGVVRTPAHDLRYTDLLTLLDLAARAAQRDPQPSEAEAWQKGYRKGAGDQRDDPANFTAPRNPYLAAQPSVPAPSKGRQ